MSRDLDPFRGKLLPELMPFYSVSNEVYRQRLRAYEHREPTMFEQVAAFVEARHLIYQAFFTDATAHEAYRLAGGQPMSYGQCVPASCVLHDELSMKYPTEQFLLNSGRVMELKPPTEGSSSASSLEEIMPAHVWISWVRGRLDEHVIIDVTADQSLRLPPVVMATSDQLVKRGFIYDSRNPFRTSEELLKVFEKRERNIRSRIGSFTLAMTNMSHAFNIELHKQLGVPEDQRMTDEEIDRIVECIEKWST